MVHPQRITEGHVSSPLSVLPSWLPAELLKPLCLSYPIPCHFRIPLLHLPAKYQIHALTLGHCISDQYLTGFREVVEMERDFKCWGESTKLDVRPTHANSDFAINCMVLTLKFSGPTISYKIKGLVQ